MNNWPDDPDVGYDINLPSLEELISENREAFIKMCGEQWRAEEERLFKDEESPNEIGE